MIDCTALRSTLAQTVGEAFRCSSYDDDTLKVITPFAFPNGDLIDVYLIEQANGLVATDYGEALRYLSSINVSVEDGKRNAQFSDFLRVSGVRNTRGNLVVDVRQGAEAQCILRLCEAMLRVADLGISSRQRSIGGEFRAILKPQLRQIAGSLAIAEDPRFFGLSGEVYDLDFEVQRRYRDDGLVLITLSARDYSAADEAVDETVRIWDDLKGVVAEDRRATIIDTTNPNVVWREQWLRQLARHSEVVLYEELPRVGALLEAA